MNAFRHVIIKALAVTSCLCFVMLCNAQHQLLPGDSSVMVLPDSSNFVTASVLVASPGQPIYSVFGHCAIRMQCPAHHLDFVYSQSTNPDASDFFRFFAGKNEIAVLAVPTEQYLADFKRDGRGVKEYKLNLTHHEKQHLWQLLDEAIMSNDPLHFDLLSENCVNMTMVMIEQSLIDEQFDAGQLPEQMYWKDGDLLRYYARHSSWAEFLFITFLGSDCDGSRTLERKLAPEFIVPVLQGATFVSGDGYRRPVLTGEAKEILPQVLNDHKAVVSPTWFFVAMLVLVVVITLFELLKGWHALAHITDVMLFAFQTLLGLLLVYTTFISSLFGISWNWFLIPFCPLAIVLWLVMTKHRRSLYFIFSVVLFIFILLTPVSSQIDLPHQLITATFAVRTASNAFKQFKP